MTALSESIYADKKPMDCLNDPLHPNDYLARWYAQSVAAALDPASASTSVSFIKRSEKRGAAGFGPNNSDVAQ